MSTPVRHNLRTRIVYSPTPPPQQLQPQVLSPPAQNQRRPLVRLEEIVPHHPLIASSTLLRCTLVSLVLLFTGLASYHHYYSPAPPSDPPSCMAETVALNDSLAHANAELTILRTDHQQQKRIMDAHIQSLRELLQTARPDYNQYVDFAIGASVNKNLTSETLSWGLPAKRNWLFQYLIPPPVGLGIYPSQILNPARNQQCWPTPNNSNSVLTITLTRKIFRLVQVGIASKDEFGASTPKLVHVYALVGLDTYKLGSIDHDVYFRKNELKWSLMDVAAPHPEFRWDAVHSIQFRLVENFGNPMFHCLFRVAAFGLEVPQHPLATV